MPEETMKTLCTSRFLCLFLCASLVLEPALYAQDSSGLAAAAAAAGDSATATALANAAAANSNNPGASAL